MQQIYFIETPNREATDTAALEESKKTVLDLTNNSLELVTFWLNILWNGILKNNKPIKRKSRFAF